MVLFHLADLPQAVIARQLDTGVGAVPRRLHKARTTLRAQLNLRSEAEDPMTSTPVPAQITDVPRTPGGRHVVLLATEDDELPIWIGAAEAEARIPIERRKNQRQRLAHSRSSCSPGSSISEPTRCLTTSAAAGLPATAAEPA